MWTKVDLAEDDGVLAEGKPEKVYLFNVGIEAVKIYQQPHDGLWVGVVVNGDWEVQFATGPLESPTRVRTMLAIWLRRKAAAWVARITEEGEMEE